MSETEAISMTLNQLAEQAENNAEGYDINNAIGEITVKGITYQMQVSLIANKKLWLGENNVRFSEVVKIH